MHSWPHAPSKLVTEPGTYFVTSATYHKEQFFNSREKLLLLQSIIFEVSLEFSFELQAWAIFQNHYHLIGFMPIDSGIRKMTAKIHSVSARELNRLDEALGPEDLAPVPRNSSDLREVVSSTAKLRSQQSNQARVWACD